LTLKGFMSDAYGGKVRKKKRIEKKTGEFVLGFEDFVQRLGEKPSRDEVEELVSSDDDAIFGLIESASPLNPREEKIRGYLSGIVAERSSKPLNLAAGNFAGAEMNSGVIVLKARAGGKTPPDHVGEKMRGGRIVLEVGAGHYLGQEMEGGGIVAPSCKDYAFRNMKGGWGVVKGDSGNYVGVGNSGGNILVKGRSGLRCGWLMHSGKIRVNGNVGEYLGLMMNGGKISIGGTAGSKAGWRMKDGKIVARGYGPEVGVEKVGGKIFRRTSD